MSTSTSDEQERTGVFTMIADMPSRFIKEKIASENLIYSHRNQYFILFIPILVTFLIYPFRDLSFVGGATAEEIGQGVFADNVEVIKIFILIVVSYLFSFGMTRIEGNGSYGYWLALGADRQRFIYFLLVDVTLMTTGGMVLPIILLSLFTALKLDLLVILVYIVVVVISQMFLVATVFFFTELLAFAEIEFSVIMITFLLINFFAEEDSFARKLLFPEYYVYSGISFVYPLLQLLIAAILGYIGLRLHLEKDIELGG